MPEYLQIEKAWLNRQRIKARERKRGAKARREPHTSIRWSGQHAAYDAVFANATPAPAVNADLLAACEHGLGNLKAAVELLDKIQNNGLLGSFKWRRGYCFPDTIARLRRAIDNAKATRKETT